MFSQYVKKMRESLDSEVRRSILNLVEANSHAKLLDTGCANGSFTMELGERIGTDKLYGIEIASEYLGENLKQKAVNICAADLNEPLPLDDEDFDVVHSNQVIEHLYNTDVYIKEIYRVLKPGGYAIISTPNLAAWYTIFFLVLGLQPISAKVSDRVCRLGNPFDPGGYMAKYERQYPYHEHLRLFTYHALKELFQYYGFKIVKIIGVGYYPFYGNAAQLLSRIDPRHSVILVMKVRKG